MDKRQQGAVCQPGGGGSSSLTATASRFITSVVIVEVRGLPAGISGYGFVKKRRLTNCASGGHREWINSQVATSHMLSCVFFFFFSPLLPDKARRVYIRRLPAGVNIWFTQQVETVDVKPLPALCAFVPMAPSSSGGGGGNKKEKKNKSQTDEFINVRHPLQRKGCAPCFQMPSNGESSIEEEAITQFPRRRWA